jgi:DNA-binding response OmpR family regulator
VKPFHFGELSARLRALLRRCKRLTHETTLTFKDLVIDLIDRKALRAGADRDLTPRQFEVLAYLVRHRNQLVTREMLAKEVWRAETATWTNVIEVQIANLRRKIERKGESVLLHTVRGEGYLLGDLPC